MDGFGDIKMVTRVSIIGITGYTGLELLRMLNAHPEVTLAHVTSRQHNNTPIGDVYPHLAHMDIKVSNPDLDVIAQDSDVVFLCLPHKTAQDTVAALHGKVKIIDLSADFRLDDVETYEKHYNVPHIYPELLKSSVYGLPELVEHHRIANAKIVANPGCFALLSQLMLYPFAGTIQHADIMAITGSSGSGKSASDGTHHPVRSHNMKSYNINKHRHIPEICRTAQIKADQLNFVPTSGPFVRGIFATAFITTDKDVDTANAYDDSPFVRVMDTVALANIVGSNFCDLSFQRVSKCEYIVQGVIDNLVKGAAGCAVQNMNLMCGYDETLGLLSLSPLYP
ncbi:MAG: N-acetyl-gamma-glutamyl-phosphate reductase [Alphaproteobacteria bacterium]|nr:MAG: N-acetyl-gamma-glutamyl-phosphate reductase [Alphaproteobacteria bacterium]